MTTQDSSPSPLEEIVKSLTSSARAAARTLAVSTTDQKNAALKTAADAIEMRADWIRAANQKDLDAESAQSLSAALRDRLTLNDKRLTSMIEGLRQVVALPDPVGRLLNETRRPNGLLIKKVSVPIGVIFIIYESRPNVTIDAAALTLKSGNAVILRGGKEALHTNTALADILRDSLTANGLPPDAVQIVPTTDRAIVPLLLKENQTIDLVIPRGGESLIRAVVADSTIPVIKHYKGVCHIFVDSQANIETATRIILNAKVQRPSVCNALETLLVHKDIADMALPAIGLALMKAGVVLRGDERTRALLPTAEIATDDDWRAEYLDLILAVRVVDSLDVALDHIETYGSRHTDAIISDNPVSLERFRREVDSACVHINTTTRFSDGFEYGLGAEIGISTDKLHARGPMGLEELTSYKYIVEGEGQIRE